MKDEMDDQQLTTAQRRARLRGLVMRRVHETGDSYDECFRAEASLHPALVSGDAPSLSSSAERPPQKVTGQLANGDNEKFLELVRRLMREQGLTYDQAWRKAAADPEGARLLAAMHRPGRARGMRQMNCSSRLTPPSPYPQGPSRPADQIPTPADRARTTKPPKVD